MSLFRSASRAYLLDRMLRDSRRRSGSGWYGPSSYGRRGRRSRSGFGFRGPLPSYSRRTRGGSRVTVTGCCLPIPLALTIGATAGIARLVRSR